MRRLRYRAVAVAMCLLVGSCGMASPSPSSLAAPNGTTPQSSTPSVRFRPHLDPTPCPDDVTSQVVLQISCSYLTVLEDRTKSDGPTIELFVIRVDPPGGTTTPDPMILVRDLAALDDYGGMTGAGQRTHRIQYLIDPRGVGHSKPSLDCPEVVAAGPALTGLRLRDPARRARLLDAIRACHDRLDGQDIDLAAYDVAASADDLEDLRTTLGIRTWNIGAEGDASRIALEVAARFPSGIRSMFIDSLALPTPDVLSDGPTSLDLAITGLVAACAAQPACGRGYPDLGTEIRDAITRLDAKPLTFDVTGTVEAVQLGHPIRVVVDGAALARVIRADLATGGGSGAANVPRTVLAVLDGKLSADDQAVASLSSDAGDCLGLLPHCDELLNFGALYSIICGSFASQIDHSRLEASIDGRPAYADIFDPSPLLVACDVWPVGHPTPAPVGAATRGVPTLVMHGPFDPFSSPASELHAAVSGSANVFSLEIPNQSYNALGYTDCAVGIRNSWVDTPTAPPADTSCLGLIPPIPLAP